MTSVPRFSNIWQGYPTPPSRSSSQALIHHTMAKSIEEIPVV
jgi:hypothetical protein